MHKTGCGYQEMIKRSGLTRKTSNCYLTMSVWVSFSLALEQPESNGQGKRQTGTGKRKTKHPSDDEDGTIGGRIKASLG